MGITLILVAYKLDIGSQLDTEQCCLMKFLDGKCVWKGSDTLCSLAVGPRI